MGVVLGVAILVASCIAIPGLLDGISDAWQWFAKGESFQSKVTESISLFGMKGNLKFRLRYAELCLSRFIYFVPVVLVALADYARDRKDRASLLLLVSWSLGLAVATCIQQRFSNSFSVVMAPRSQG